MPFLVTFQKLAVDKKVAKDAADMKEKGKRMANNAGKWIKAHFDEIQFFTVESYIVDGSEVDEKFKDITFTANVAFVRYEGATPYFYFVKVGLVSSGFLERGAGCRTGQRGQSCGNTRCASLLCPATFLQRVPFFRTRTSRRSFKQFRSGRVEE